MDTVKIGNFPFIIAVIGICFVEITVSQFFTPSLISIGIARCFEAAVVLTVFYLFYKSAALLGLSRKQLLSGLLKGTIWSAVFGVIVFILGICLFFYGINPIKLIHVSMPDTFSQIVLFYIIGGFIAPIAEEIFFRGLVYGYIRGLLYDKIKTAGILIALFISTFLFVFAHQGNAGIPLPQLVGGFVFCASFELEKKLLTPIVIHCLGNIALFSISLF